MRIQIRLCLLLTGLMALRLTNAADFSSEWLLASSVNTNPVAIRCALQQQGAQLRGQCQPQVEGIEPSILTGDTDGVSARWGYDVVFRGNPGHVAYEATLNGDGTLTGTMFLSGMPQAFTASRIP
ncbi:MAG: hypothetical protein H6978_13935 [Gammaproteobacteria bacterium]|nr:hypothetical protein [Gammaproteobacteria bacterium]